MKVPRINWQNVGKVTEPGRYMFKFGWVTVTPEDLAIWSQYPDATFALYESPGPERLNDEYRLGSVQLTQAASSEYDAAQERGEIKTRADNLAIFGGAGIIRSNS